MRFPVDDKHLITWMRVKKLRRKTLAHDALTEDSLVGVKTMIKISVREALTLLCGGVGIVWSTTTRTRVHMLSLSPLNVLIH